MMSFLKSKGNLFLASSLCDGLEDNDIKQVTTLLLNKEANPNTLIPTHGVTPFHLVIGNDSEAFAEEVTKLFLRHGGDPNIRSVDGLTPVHLAAAWGRVTVLELLLANGGDPLCLDDEGHSPFHYAFDGKYYKAIVLLSKYCENNTIEDKVINCKMTFDKLLINSGDTIAEYATSEISDLFNGNELKKNEDDKLSDIKNKYYFDYNKKSLHSDHQSDINTAELRICNEMDKEKCLLYEIINQLSSSLKTSSEDREISNEHFQYKENQYDRSPLSILNDNVTLDAKNKFLFKPRVRKRSVTPRYRRKIFEQNNAKAPLVPVYNPNDTIISKSPNCQIGKSAEKEWSYLSPKVINNESKFKAFTPCMTRNEFPQSEEFILRRQVARSTPRRKRFSRQYSSLRKLKRNNRFTSSENTSPESANSLSPDQNDLDKLHYKFNKHLAVKLHENKYDDDVPTNSNFNEIKNYTENLIKACNNNLVNLKLEKTDCKETSKQYLNKDNVQNKIMEKLKTDDTSNIFDEGFVTSRSSFTSQSYVSVQEEYKYEYPDDGVAFLERRIYALPPCMPTEDCTTANRLWPQSLNVSVDISMTNDILRRMLINLGDNPGPITDTTKQLYLKRLIRLKDKTCNPSSFATIRSKVPFKTDCKFDLESFFIYGDWVNHLARYKIIEKNIFEEFSMVDPSRKWREGINKTCFNYLLLDTRVTNNLPLNAESLTKPTIWSTFLSGIFYVGKGTRNRPYYHLKDAFDAWVSNQCSKSTKVKRILDIWNAGCGVVCLHIYQNTIPVEAYTREAAMIDALGVENLCNCKNGGYYGKAATWNIKEKCNFGRYLLHQAMQIYLHEGERQIHPHNL
ncbi:uncharacterized protein LOC122403659 [Colletes gigas]|uniref:uncharacterized protein LOC122403659 n=1 Tax=Colletes gigas TaxID=935657 RepID=UPI001C9A99BF|nr:uncharacterized protein LOC122403659 [Colletes gigas]XP_043263233.1 uncharacterized protein LOC122403659 [Colletes gigas]